ncbi:integrase [Gossypium australe]|uniref:Integrase n=1 Tax=Gossypium australe TaxID=47621 RepID=A0A5B6VMC3_9ROSI|nr:integrase [Gossypium australe]
MYNDLKQFYWWQGMKRDISEFVSKCFICQQVKAEHQVPSSLLQPVMIPEWKWNRITMYFVSGSPLTPKKKDAIWVVVDRLTKFAHFILVRTNYSLDRLDELYISKIVRLYGRSKIYVAILEEIGRSFGYKVEFQYSFSSSDRWSDRESYSDSRRHVEMLSDPSHVISPVYVEIQTDLTYSEEPIKILAREIKELRNKHIALVKVLWHKHGIEEATWELKETMRKKYPNLFTSKTFGDEIPKGESCNSPFLS